MLEKRRRERQYLRINNLKQLATIFLIRKNSLWHGYKNKIKIEFIHLDKGEF